VRAKSNPIIDPGPPAESPRTSRISNQIGARPGQTSTAVHSSVVPATMTRTNSERRRGKRWASTPRIGPQTIPANANRLSSLPATCAEVPCAWIRKGYPQARAKTAGGNWVTKCVHMPSRVPGCFQAATRSSRTRAPVTGPPSESVHWRPVGSPARDRTATNSPRAAMVPKALVHPRSRRSTANGTALRTWPT
jgi:hypothetical protein